MILVIADMEDFYCFGDVPFAASATSGKTWSLSENVSILSMPLHAQIRRNMSTLHYQNVFNLTRIYKRQMSE